MKNSCLCWAAVLIGGRLDLSALTGKLHIRAFSHFISIVNSIDPKNEIREQTDYEPHQKQIDQVDEDKECPLQILLIIVLT